MTTNNQLDAVLQQIATATELHGGKSVVSPQHNGNVYVFTYSKGGKKAVHLIKSTTTRLVSSEYNEETDTLSFVVDVITRND